MKAEEHEKIQLLQMKCQECDKKRHSEKDSETLSGRSKRNLEREKGAFQGLTRERQADVL